MYYQQLLAESKRLEAQIKQLEQEISTYPEGRLLSSQNGKYTKWYIRNGQSTKHISSRNHSLLSNLATREYLFCSIEDLTFQKELIDSYLINYSSHISKTNQLINKHPQIEQLLRPYFLKTQSHNTQIETWLNTPFQPNPIHQDKLTHRCPSGHYVRSKSEAMIDTLLYSNKIAFKYECPLLLGDTIVYPDFTIMHPLTMQLIYWEHYGMMDDPSYIRKATTKTQNYALNGIVPNINLIITCETSTSPLSFETIDNIIQSKIIKI